MKIYNRAFIFFALTALIFGMASCQKGSAAKSKEFSIAVFVPGVVAGSPTYEMMVAGSEKAVKESPGATVKVIEGGFNQGEWQEKITTIASTGRYDLIVTSNPSMPKICAEVSRQFPLQKFLVLDGYIQNHPAIHTVLFNQMEQGYLSGYFAGLVTGSHMPGINEDLVVGFIAAQEYPMLNMAIRPGFQLGLTATNQEARVDFRVVGNWYDATKAKELAASMFDQGVDVILTIAGSANEGVISAAKERGKYVLWFDSNAYSVAPGVIIGCSVIHEDKAAYEKVKQAINGTLEFGRAEIKGVKDGFVDFIEDDPLFREYVPEDIRIKQGEIIHQFKDGSLEFFMPVY